MKISEDVLRRWSEDEARITEDVLRRWSEDKVGDKV
jgi:hypothetical protein